MSCDGSELSRVFREARTTITWTGMEKLTSNTFIHTNSTSNIVNIASDLFTEICDFVDKRDLGCQESIGCVLGKFSRFERSDYKRCLDQIKRPIQILHNGDRFFVATSNHYAVGTHEVVDSGTFTQKFGIRNNTELGANFLTFVNEFANMLART